MDDLKFNSSENVDLTDDDREAIHIPGHIQPHGVLLVLQEPHLKILQVSNNTEQFFGIPAGDLIDRDLDVLFLKQQIEFLKNYLSQETTEIFQTINFFKQVDSEFKVFQGQFHRHDGVIILELEPLSSSDNLSLDFYYLFKKSILNIKDAPTFIETTQSIVREVRQVTGYDRVMLYRFEDDGSGVVIAEDKADEIEEAYLGLHYPASDISQQARKLYYKNWLRLIVDINYQPVEIIPPNNPLTGMPLDLSFSSLRSISPCHVEYSKNIGLAGSLTISLVDERKLWGLIVCHHYSPKYVDEKIRHYCEFLGQLMSLELVKRQEREAQQDQKDVKLIQNEIKHALSEQNNSITSVLKQNSLKLLELVNAQGAAIYWGESLTLVGQSPSKEAVLALVAWFLNFSRQEVFLTNSLSQLYPPAREFKDRASGLLAISIFLNQTSYHLFWFKPEIIQTVNWGGNPHQAVLVDDDGSPRPSPRRSFELWKETVREKSLPWQQAEIDAALELRNTLLLTALEFSQAALLEAAERAEVANRAKSQFLAKMSHELRTPLNAILGFTQLMNRNTSLSVQQREHIDIINRSGEHLLSLINDVLEMSKIEAGQLTFNENSFDLYKLLDSIKEIFQLKASAKGLQLIFECTADVPQYISTDESKVRQVLFNLLDNAIKFTQAGNVTLRVFCAQQPTTIIFEVSDTGPGIAFNELGVLFEPFVQTESGRHSMQGTGLGLPISQQFVRLMEGEMTVSSTLGVGTIVTFDIQVRLVSQTDVASPTTTKQIIGLEPGQPSYRLLIVEDVEENCRLLFELLSGVGFEVRTAANGREAIAVWQAWKPHLIWMDMLMPVMDGWEATRQIKATPEGQATVIIAITANAFSEEQVAAREAGCDDFMPKPYRESILLEKIAQHLGVRYHYHDDIPITSSQQSIAILELTPDDLTVMSQEWISQLHQAAHALDDSRIIELIEQIPNNQAFLAKKLTNLVNGFRLDVIFDLTTVAHE